MRELWLMRHGHAAADAVGGDAARALTADGVEVVEGAGRALAAMGVRPDELWHSPFLRARQTAELVVKALGVERVVVKEGLTPHGSSREVAEELFGAHARCLLVVSHLPLLPELCAELLDAPARLDVRPSSIVHLRLWGGDRAKGAAVLSGFYAGDALAALGR